MLERGIIGLLKCAGRCRRFAIANRRIWQIRFSRQYRILARASKRNHRSLQASLIVKETDNNSNWHKNSMAKLSCSCAEGQTRIMFIKGFLTKRSEDARPANGCIRQSSILWYCLAYSRPQILMEPLVLGYFIASSPQNPQTFCEHIFSKASHVK